jgi:hypothetical protein
MFSVFINEVLYVTFINFDNMRARPVVLLLLGIIFLAACEKNNLPKVPSIGLTFAGPDSMKVTRDDYVIQFSIVDGDADISNSAPCGIYLKDSRYDTGFTWCEFPKIKKDALDPDKGLQGSCFFLPFPGPEPRLDSLHMATGDTLMYELYVKDNAGNESNHLKTGRIIVRP